MPTIVTLAGPAVGGEWKEEYIFKIDVIVEATQACAGEMSGRLPGGAQLLKHEHVGVAMPLAGKEWSVKDKISARLHWSKRKDVFLESDVVLRYFC